MGAAKCNVLACDRSRGFSGEETITLSPSARYCIRLPAVRRTWSKSQAKPGKPAFPLIKDDRHQAIFATPNRHYRYSVPIDG